MTFLKHLATTLIILFSINAALSQGLSIGIRTGAAYYTVKNDLADENAQFDLGVDVAVPLEWSITSAFSIQPELHYTQKGVAFKTTGDGVERRLVFKTNYLELPILFKADHGTDQFSCYLFVAPSVGYALNRHVAERVGSIEKVKEDIDFIKDGPAQDRRWEFSAIGGIGMKLKAGPGHVVADARYSLGLTDDTKFDGEEPSDWKETTNRGCILSVGYMIPLGW